MALLESVKERFEKITGWARPSARDLDAALRPRKALSGSRTMASSPTIQSCPSCSIGAPSGLRANSIRRQCSKSFSSATAGTILAEWHLRIAALPLRDS